MAHSQWTDKIELIDFGVPNELSKYLLLFISYNHPGEQESIYHNFNHTLEVANTSLNIVCQIGFYNKWKVLVCLAGLLHDIDPSRIHNTPPSVDRTIKFIDSNKEIKSIINWFCEIFGFTVGQLKTLILATDYDYNPEKRVNKWNKFVSECEIHFQNEFFLTQDNQFTNLGVVLGEILAYSDKLATYIQPIDIVLQRISGLAFELRTSNKSNLPTNKDLTSKTGHFIYSELVKHNLFNITPIIYKDKLLDNFRFFE